MRNRILAKLRMPDGTNRPVTAREVEESHHRQGRYRKAPVLAEVFALPATVVAEPVAGAEAAAEEVTEVLSLEDVLAEDALEAE